MRISSGSLRGRAILVPKGGLVRPTSEKVRASIFDILGAQNILGTAVLDVFCGSGALGLEALSRGAKSCVFVDKSRPSIVLTKANIENMELSDYAHVIHASALRPPPIREDIGLADIAFFDPPYKKGLISKSLVSMKNWLSQDCTCVLESEGGWDCELPQGFEIYDKRKYGDTLISFVRRS